MILKIIVSFLLFFSTYADAITYKNTLENETIHSASEHFYVDFWANIKQDLKDDKIDALPIVGRTLEKAENKTKINTKVLYALLSISLFFFLAFVITYIWQRTLKKTIKEKTQELYDLNKELEKE